MIIARTGTLKAGKVDVLNFEDANNGMLMQNDAGGDEQRFRFLLVDPFDSCDTFYHMKLIIIARRLRWVGIKTSSQESRFMSWPKLYIFCRLQIVTVTSSRSFIITQNMTFLAGHTQYLTMEHPDLPADPSPPTAPQLT